MISIKTFREKLWPYFLVLCVGFVFLLYFSFFKKFDVDEIESIHSAWYVFTGKHVYVDFFENHHPFFYYFLSPLVYLSHLDVHVMIAARMVMVVFCILIFICIYSITSHLFNSKAGLISAVLLLGTTTFVQKIIEIRPDVPQVLCALVSVFYLLLYYERRSLNYLILSSFCLALSFLFLQKVFLLAFAFALVFLWDFFTQKITLREIGIYLLVFVATIAPYFCYLILKHQWQAYLLSNWSVNVNIYKYAVAKTIHKHSYLNGLWRIFKDNPPLWIFWGMGLSRLLNNDHQKRLGLISLFLVGSQLLIPLPYSQYFLLITPLCAVIAAHTIVSLSNTFNCSDYLVVSLLAFMIALRSGSMVVKMEKDPYIVNNWQLEKMNYVLNVTTPEDYVYDGGHRFNLFRKDLDMFGVRINSGPVLTYKRFLGYPIYDIYNLIELRKPKIISDFWISHADERIKKNYRIIHAYLDLWIRR